MTSVALAAERIYLGMDVSRDKIAVAVLRPEKFRIVVQSAVRPLPEDEEGSFSGAWTHAVQDWEP